MSALRVVHYVNQFFGGVGGEDHADHRPSLEMGPKGPGMLLQDLLGDEGRIVATIVCGDSFFAVSEAEAVDLISAFLSETAPDLVICGPAFDAGRYGYACAKVAALAEQGLGIPAVTGMYPENPGFQFCRGIALTAATGRTAAGMRDGMAAIVRLARKRLAGEPLGPADEDGYIPTQVRKNTFHPLTGAERAVTALLAKVGGRPYRTEIPLPAYDRVPPPLPLASLRGMRLALVTEASVVPRGNPDRLESARGTKWFKYPLEGLQDLAGEAYQTVHGGFANAIVNADPDRAVPLDAMRFLEQSEGFSLYDHFYVTTGMATPIADSLRIGQEIARDLQQAGVNGVLLTAT